jgi:hypothetical protein
MAKSETSDAELTKQIREATKHHGRRRAAGLVATSVRYDAPAKRVVVELLNGVSFAVPLRTLPALGGADDRLLRRVTLDPMGVGIRWPELDVDYEIGGLLRTSLGASWAMGELARAGGQVRSAAKARASRANGAKGGRPRKRAARTTSR